MTSADFVTSLLSALQTLSHWLQRTWGASPGRVHPSAFPMGPGEEKASRTLLPICSISRTRLQVGWGRGHLCPLGHPLLNPRTCGGHARGLSHYGFSRYWRELTGAYSWVSPSNGNGSPALLTPSRPVMFPGISSQPAAATLFLWTF